MEEVDNANKRLSDIESDREEYTKILQNVATLEYSIEEEKVKLKKQEDRIDELGKIEYDSISIDTEIAGVKGKIERQEDRIRAAKDKVDTMEKILEKTSSLQHKLDETKYKIRDLNNQKRDLEKTTTTNGAKIKSLNEKLKKIDRGIQSIMVDLRSYMTEKRRDELNQELSKLEDLERKLEELLEQGETLNREDLEKMIQAVERFELSEARLKAISDVAAVSVKIEGELDASWSVDGLQSEVDSETSFAQKMTIEGKEFKIDIARKSSEEEDWVEQRRSSSSEITGYSVSDADELRKRWEDESERAKKGESLRDKIEESRSREEIEAELGNLPDKRQDMGEVDERDLENSMEELNEEKEELEGELEMLKEANEPLEKELISLKIDLGNLREVEIATDTLASAEYKRKDAEIESGSISTRKKELERLDQGLRDLVKDHELLINRRESERSSSMDGLKKEQRKRRHTERDIRNKEAELIYLNNKAKELGGEGLQQSYIEENFAVDDAVKERDRIKRKVDAQNRLRLRFKNALDNATEMEIEPIKKRVQKWLRHVTADKWRELEMDQKLDVTRIGGPGRPPLHRGEQGESENFASGGLIQVVHALIRLAVACHIYDVKKEEAPNIPPVALVMDESQGHVDAVRVQRLARVFNDQIMEGRVQVIALSHRRDEFQDLDAKNYDVERRDSTDYRGLD